MSRCTNPAMACIFWSCVAFPAVSALTSCLMGCDASICPLIRSWYQLPMLCQLAISLFRDVPSAGKNDTIIWRATPLQGGISGSYLIPVTPLTTHCTGLPVPSAGLTSVAESHDALYSHPGGSRSE